MCRCGTDWLTRLLIATKLPSAPIASWTARASVRAFANSGPTCSGGRSTRVSYAPAESAENAPQRAAGDRETRPSAHPGRRHPPWTRSRRRCGKTGTRQASSDDNHSVFSASRRLGGWMDGALTSNQVLPTRRLFTAGVTGAAVVTLCAAIFAGENAVHIRERPRKWRSEEHTSELQSRENLV